MIHAVWALADSTASTPISPPHIEYTQLSPMLADERSLFNASLADAAGINFDVQIKMRNRRFALQQTLGDHAAHSGKRNAFVFARRQRNRRECRGTRCWSGFGGEHVGAHDASAGAGATDF